MKGRTLLLFVLLATCFHSCTQNDEPLFVLTSGDTLRVAEIDSLAPDADLHDSLKLVRLARQFALVPSHRYADADSLSRSLSEELASTLERKTADNWSAPAAHFLLASGKKLLSHLKEKPDSTTFEALLDSLSTNAGYRRISDQKPIKKNTIVVPGTFAPSSANVSCDLLSLVLILPDETACLLVEFAEFEAEESQRLGKSSASQMVDGLLQGTSPSEKALHEKTRAAQVQATQTLRMRPQKSIQDTILNHAANLKALYKKALKSSPSIRGVVWVKFTVAPSGKVLSASVKRSDIQAPGFTSALLRYVKKLRFEPIAGSAGDMKFVFPFEFAPE